MNFLLPLGLAGGSAIESQIVENGTFAGFQVRWRKTRKFAIDMAGFAVNLRVILKCVLSSCFLLKK